MIPAAFLAWASWMKSINSPSRLDCRQSAFRPNCAAVSTQSFSTSASVGVAVGLGLAGPQQIEVRAVEHVNRLLSAGALSRCLGHPNPGNVAVGGAVIGNNRPKGKPLGPLVASLKCFIRFAKKPRGTYGNRSLTNVRDEPARPPAATSCPAPARVGGKGGHLCPRDGVDQQVALPQRAMPIFSFRPSRPTAPTTTCLPIT